MMLQNYQKALTFAPDCRTYNNRIVDSGWIELTIEQTRILDYESYVIDGVRYLKKAESEVKRLQRRLEKLKGHDSHAILFYLANIYGGMGVIHAKLGNWLDAMSNAMISVKLLRRVIHLQPNFHEALLGIGIFEYYTSSNLGWLPFIDNKAKKGIATLRKASRLAAPPFNYAARNSLCWILIDNNYFSEADSLAVSVLAQYPENTVFLRIQALVALRTGDYKKAAAAGKNLLDVTKKRSPVNWSDCMTAWYILVRVQEETGNGAESCRLAKMAVQEKVPSEFQRVPHIKRHIRYLYSAAGGCTK